MNIKKKAKDVFSFLSRIALSLILLAIVFSKIDMVRTKEILVSADIVYIFYSFLVFFVVNIAMLGRWYLFIRAMDISVPIYAVVRNFFFGLFGNLFLPSSVGGDILKTFGLCKHSMNKTKVVASVLLDRLSGFAAIVIVSICSFSIGYRYIGEPSLLIPIGVIAVGSFLVLLVLFNERIYSFCCRVFNRFPNFKRSLMNLHYDITLLKGKKRRGLEALGVSCLSQVIFAFVWYLIARALHQEISPIYFLIFVPITCVASSFPSIGGLGVREAGAVFLFGKVGVEQGVAVSISLITYLFMVIIGIIGGVFYVSTLSSGRIQHYTPDACCVE